jgi:hypothetical protein
MKLYPGMPVLYRLRPGQTRMGQQDLAAIVTRHAGDTVDLIAFPPRTAITDALVLENVQRLSQETGGHCWHPAPDERADEITDLKARVVELEEMIDGLTAPKPSAPKPPAAAKKPALV